MVVNSVRKNDAVQLKQAFVHFIYQLPHREELQCQYMHKIMVKTEFMLKDSYGMDESLNQQFENYYSNMRNLKAAKAVEYKHMTFYEAAKLARDAQVGEMWLTHYSPSLTRPEEYMDDVRKIFPAAKAGKDRKSVELDFEKDE